MKIMKRYVFLALSFLIASCGQEKETESVLPKVEETTVAEPTPAAVQTPVSEPEPKPVSAPESTPEERYNNGSGAPTDPVEAIAWYTEYAEAGVPDASYRLGMCYYAARSVPMNFVKAVEQLRVAAEKGHSEAAAKLAECYEWGVGVEAAPAEAAKWRAAVRPDQ